LEGNFTNFEGVIYLASTNKTANIGLPKWERTDPVEVEGFNSLLDSIDLAIGKRLDAQLLRDITPEQGATTMYIDLSDLDFKDYLIIAISFDQTPEIFVHPNKTYNDLGFGFDGSTVFFFPLKNASRTIHAFSTMVPEHYKNDIQLAYQFNTLTGLLLVAVEAVGANAKIRIWGVK